MQSRPDHPKNSKLISKFSYMRPVFLDYLSVSYDYGELYLIFINIEIVIVEIYQ